MMNSIDRNRLKWKCRRGLLELDLLLERYVNSNPQDARLSELLDLTDNDLWDIVCGRSNRYPSHLRETVARLRAV
jgi:antitoxin CptB